MFVVHRGRICLKSTRSHSVEPFRGARRYDEHAWCGRLFAAGRDAAGEPKSLTTETFDVLGFRIVVSAQARWEWTFEPGVTEAFTEPGGAYPDRSVSHTYDGPGERAVSVTTYWRATYTVNGDGPFAVPGPELTKTAGPLQVPVREARAELIGG